MCFLTAAFLLAGSLPPLQFNTTDQTRLHLGRTAWLPLALPKLQRIHHDP